MSDTSKLTSFKRPDRVPRPTLDPNVVIALSQASPGRVITWTAVTWLWIIGAFLFYFAVEAPWAFIISFIVIGVQQHALSIWVHEASHHHIARNGVLNDLVANLLYAAPILISVESYRSRHRLHHHYLGTPQDSERHPRICVRGGRIFLELLKAIGGVYAVRLFFRYNSDQHVKWSTVNLLCLGATHGLLFLFCLLAGHWTAYITLWILPLLTLAVALTSFRAISEHQPWSVDRPVGADETIEPMTRSIRSNFAERAFFAPLNFNLHLEHDLFPEVPFHNLPALHRQLAASGYFDDNRRLHPGSYVSLLGALAFPRRSAESNPVNVR